MDAIEMLTSQHRRVRRLLREVEAAAAEQKHALFLDLADALAVHATIEDHYFYPAVSVDRTRAILLGEIEEHLALKRTLADLMRSGLTDAAFDALLSRLAAQFARHADAEEATLFPRAAEMLDQHQLESLGHLMAGAIEDLEDRDLRGTPGELDELLRIACSG